MPQSKCVHNEALAGTHGPDAYAEAKHTNLKTTGWSLSTQPHWKVFSKTKILKIPNLSFIPQPNPQPTSPSSRQKILPLRMSLNVNIYFQVQKRIDVSPEN